MWGVGCGVWDVGCDLSQSMAAKRAKNTRFLADDISIDLVKPSRTEATHVSRAWATIWFRV